MNKLIVALIAGTFAAVAGAQAPAPAAAPAAESTAKKLTTNPKAAEVGAVTSAASNSNTTATDAAMQKVNTDKSKMEPKVAKPKLGTPENEALMQKASKP